MLRVNYLVLGMCGTNCYLVYDDETKDGVIIDPAASADKITAAVEKYGINPAAILITHGHFDHILAVDEIREKFSIKVYALSEEKEILTDSYKNLSLQFTGEAFTSHADVYLEDGQELVLAGHHIRVIGVKGHTVGGACYYFDDDGILISGDTLFNGSVGRGDFPTGSMSLLLRQIDEKLMVLPNDVTVYPGHGDATTIGYERVNNGFINFK